MAGFYEEIDHVMFLLTEGMAPAPPSRHICGVWVSRVRSLNCMVGDFGIFPRQEDSHTIQLLFEGERSDQIVISAFVHANRMVIKHSASYFFRAVLS
jgi:hypothetical protein